MNSSQTQKILILIKFLLRIENLKLQRTRSKSNLRCLLNKKRWRKDAEGQRKINVFANAKTQTVSDYIVPASRSLVIAMSIASVTTAWTTTTTKRQEISWLKKLKWFIKRHLNQRAFSFNKFKEFRLILTDAIVPKVV